MRILLLPPDERPVCAKLPRMIAACAGADVITPPRRALPSFRAPADLDALHDWIVEIGPECDGAVISLDLLAHGGLVPSRLTDDSVVEVLNRLGTVRSIPLRAGAPRFAAMVVTRVPDLDDATEEPEYWARHGRQIHTLSAALDGTADVAGAAAARAHVPAHVTQDWLWRRLRNHTANIGALDLAMDGAVDLLALTADDTSPRGLPAAERAWLEAWTARLGLREHVLHYPGADEVPSVLVARLLRGKRPRVAVHSADAEGLMRIAPYEDRPVLETVRGQVAAVGADLVDDRDRADLVLAVHPPTGGAGDWALAPPDMSGVSADATWRLADDICGLGAEGKRVAVADCAWPNGGDPGLVHSLAERGALSGLAGYAGWNTAGNTIGTALAHGLAGLVGNDAARNEARERLLVHRLLEDVGYQARVRTEMGGIAGDALDGATQTLADLLDDELETLGELGTRWRVRPGSAWLPWGRTFECDFDLERAPM